MIQQQKDILTNISLAIEEITDTYCSKLSQGHEIELSKSIKNLAVAFRIVAETMVEQEENDD